MVSPEQESPPVAAVPTSNNTNSEAIARDEHVEMAKVRGLTKPAVNDPKGLMELYNVLVVMSPDTPNSHQLFSVMGRGFTVGGARSFFGGLGKK